MDIRISDNNEAHFIFTTDHFKRLIMFVFNRLFYCRIFYELLAIHFKSFASFNWDNKHFTEFVQFRNKKNQLYQNEWTIFTKCTVYSSVQRVFWRKLKWWHFTLWKLMLQCFYTFFPLSNKSKPKSQILTYIKICWSFRAHLCCHILEWHIC